MEALAALGVAGNVVQFVQFAGQLISQFDEIRKTGTTNELQHIPDIEGCHE